MEFHVQTSPTPINYHHNSRDFCEAAWRCFGGREGKIIDNGRINWLPVPTVVNAAFSCEMSLKAVLLFEGKTFPKEHNLERLFVNIEQKTKEIISSFCMPKNTADPYQSFLHFLQIHKNDFPNARYYIEKSGWQEMSLVGMLTIAENLSTITGAIISQKNEEFGKQLGG